MACRHRDFHRITSRYDREAGILVYICICERCGVQLKEVRRISYRPRFETTDGRPTAA